MYAAAWIATAASVVPFALALPGAARDATDYGFWNVNVTSSNAASGYRFGDVYAEYSGAPGAISHFSWLYDPTVQTTTTKTDNPLFNSSIVDYQGDRREYTCTYIANGLKQKADPLIKAIAISQTVQIDASNVTLVGNGTVTMKCGLGGNGRGCAGNLTITASPA